MKTKKISSITDVVSSINVENTVDRACSEWGSSKEKSNYKEIAHINQKETANIFGKREERILGELNTHRVNWRQEKPRKTACNILDKPV